MGRRRSSATKARKPFFPGGMAKKMLKVDASETASFLELLPALEAVSLEL
jgi:hypothetical protein